MTATTYASAEGALARLHDIAGAFGANGEEYDRAAAALAEVLRRQRMLYLEWMTAARVMELAGRAAEIPAVGWGRYGSHRPLWEDVVLPSRSMLFPLWPPQR